jgi:hypothetical protein
MKCGVRRGRRTNKQKTKSFFVENKEGARSRISTHAGKRLVLG